MDNFTLQVISIMAEDPSLTPEDLQAFIEQKAATSPWKTLKGQVITLLTPEMLEALPVGTEIVNILGTTHVLTEELRDAIVEELDIRDGFYPMGVAL